ncbi:MAG: error-prone DNA polymerase [Geminicoccaceae bacterium]
MRPLRPEYVELQVATNFSFLRGASHAEELVQTAAALGLAGISVTDRNTLAGVVRAHNAAQNAGLPLVVGCRLDLRDGPSFLCFPEDRAAYGRLCRLLTLGQRRAEKGDCELYLEDVFEAVKDQALIVLPPGELTIDGYFENQLQQIVTNLDIPPHLAAHYLYRGNDRRRLAQLANLSSRSSAPLVAVNDVHFHVPARRVLQDVITCIREGCTLADAGFRLMAHAERHLKPAAEMLRLFRGHEGAIRRTVEIRERCAFSLSELRYDYPDEPVPAGKTPQSHLENLTWEGAAERYPAGIPVKVEKTLRNELKLIATLNYAPYFLTVYDIVAYAKSQDILCQGRGSAANSAVCYCLGITAVDPTEVDLLFERFVSMERKEPPDIDVDFEHERREEVIQYVYQRYGRERAGIAATVITYRSRSAVREVGKVMGLSEDVTSALAGTIWGTSRGGMPETRVREAGLDPNEPAIKKTLELTEELIGFPRHLSQHVGGFVLTKSPLCEVVPIGNAAMDDRTFVEWDKDDLDALGILKVDVLALGMLTCIRKCFELLQHHYNLSHTLASVPADDEPTYDMLCRADSLGVFQVESRAQMNMLPRLKPRCFYDLVIEVAIVRPGPIQGDMVHPYLRRRDKLEPVSFPSPAPDHGPPDELERILKKTKGVPLFQEQAMRIAIEAAQFSPDEANKLRHAMATFRKRGTIDQMRDKFVSGMTRRGYEQDFAERCFKQIEGFGDYGFPESHSASFSKLVYVSSWLKCHYPAVFACGLLNSQPMGFYAPAQIARDAREHGVEIRPVDVNHSDWDCTLEPVSGSQPGAGSTALRLGMRQVGGMNEEQAARIALCRNGPYRDIRDIRDRTGTPVSVLARLAAADAFRSMGLDRRQALWQVRAIKSEKPLPLFAHAGISGQGDDPDVTLPEMPMPEHVVVDYQTTGLSLKAHPLSFLRGAYQARGLLATATLSKYAHNAPVAVAGVVLVRQRPGTAKGVVFLTIEDETGIANCVVWAKTMERYRRILMGARLLLVQGRLQKHGSIIHVVVDHLKDWTPHLARLADGNVPCDGAVPPDDTRSLTALTHADEVTRPTTDPNRWRQTPQRHPRNVRIMPKSRDFH